jgi:Sigma-70, region 4
VVVLRVLLDLDTATTAKALKIAPGTVMSHVSRAVAALRSPFTDRPNSNGGPTMMSDDEVLLQVRDSLKADAPYSPPRPEEAGQGVMR